MASEIAPNQPDLATALLKQLTRLSTGSCTCGTKSPDIQWHDGDCKFRRAEEIRENVEALEEQRAEQWRMRREAEASRDAALAASAYWKGAYDRMAARNKEMSSLLGPSQAKGA